MKITIKDIMKMLEQANATLKEQGQTFQLVPNFCYGAYGIDAMPNGQTGTSHLIGLGTKKECYIALKMYYYGLNDGGNK